MRFWGRKKPEDKVVVICPKCNGRPIVSGGRLIANCRQERCSVCKGMGVGMVSRSKIKEFNLTSLE